MLVYSDCPDKVPQAGQLKQQKFISHNSGSWEFQDQGANKASFILRPLLVACRPPPSCCVLT